MPVFKNKLDELLADAVLASGLMRQAMLERVRQYMLETDIAQLRKEIAVIDSLPELQMLQAAGVPAGLQSVFLFRLTQLQSGQAL
jgi:heme oxygenase